MSTRHTLSIVLTSLALAACTTVHDVVPYSDSVGLPPADAPDGSCTETEIVAGESLFDIWGTTYSGSWIHVSHPPDEATQVEILQLGDRNPVATASLPVGGYGGSHGYGGVLNFPIDRAEPMVIPVYAPEQDVFLHPTGARFQVRVCRRAAEPFPTCRAFEDCLFTGAVQTADACACAPPCGIDAALCPVPDSGDAVPACRAGMCVLPCDADAQCPDGQVCVYNEEMYEPWADSGICMTR